MDLFHLECFVALSDELHFGRASARVHVGTSALSKRVSDLERELQVRLFERTSRRVRLTPAGAELAEQARRALTEVRLLQAMAEQAAAGAVGAVRIAYSPGTGETMTLLSRGLREHSPDVLVVPEQMVSLRVHAAVRDGSASLGVSRLHPGPDLVAMELSASPVTTVVMPMNHALATKEEVTTEDLSRETLIGPPPSLATEGASPMADWRPLPTGRIFHPDVSTEGEIFDLVASGFGLFVTTEAAVRRNQRRDFVTRQLAGPIRVAHEYLMWRIDDDSPVVLRAAAVATELLPAFDRLANA
ncbi:MAG TPA: LysR family transcriptional regulator [Acidimicrobiales bacterium]|jgi:DNA-binding transcriptional LysR family regulator